jgi:hypothetical protein
MTDKVIDVTGLSSSQIAAIQEIVAAFRLVATQQPSSTNQEKLAEGEPKEEDNELEKLHEQFSWLVADIGVKEPINRSKIYDIE